MDKTDLDGLAVFLAVAVLNGFRAAALKSGVTPSAISQSVRTLERRAQSFGNLFGGLPFREQLHDLSLSFGQLREGRWG